jgi:hypothetical protein
MASSKDVGPKSTAGEPYAYATAAQRDARMAWWREAKFGMFIHWGIYAVPTGVHEGTRDAEWIMRGAKIGSSGIIWQFLGLKGAAGALGSGTAGGAS